MHNRARQVTRIENTVTLDIITLTESSHKSSWDKKIYTTTANLASLWPSEQSCHLEKDICHLPLTRVTFFFFDIKTHTHIIKHTYTCTKQSTACIPIPLAILLGCFGKLWTAYKSVIDGCCLWMGIPPPFLRVAEENESTHNGLAHFMAPWNSFLNLCLFKVENMVSMGTKGSELSCSVQ